MSIINHIDEIRSILEIYVRFETHSGIPKEQVQDMRDVLSLCDKMEDKEDDREAEPYNDDVFEGKIIEVRISNLADELRFNELMEQFRK